MLLLILGAACFIGTFWFAFAWSRADRALRPHRKVRVPESLMFGEWAVMDWALGSLDRATYHSPPEHLLRTLRRRFAAMVICMAATVPLVIYGLAAV